MSEQVAFRPVTPDELAAFVAAYPRKLTYNVTTICDPPRANWNDFERAPYWPDSVVAWATLPYDDTDPPLSHCTVIEDIDAPVPDNGKRDTDKPLMDRNGRVVAEGDRIRANWGGSMRLGGGWTPNVREHTVLIRDKGTKYEKWSMDDCHNHLRGFDFEVIAPPG